MIQGLCPSNPLRCQIDTRNRPGPPRRGTAFLRYTGRVNRPVVVSKPDGHLRVGPRTALSPDRGRPSGVFSTPGHPLPHTFNTATCRPDAVPYPAWWDHGLCGSILYCRLWRGRRRNPLLNPRRMSETARSHSHLHRMDAQYQNGRCFLRADLRGRCTVIDSTSVRHSFYRLLVMPPPRIPNQGSVRVSATTMG